MNTLRLTLFCFVLSMFCWHCRQADQNTNPSPPLPPPVAQENQNRVPGRPVEAGITEDYTNTDRVIWQKPQMIIDLLGDIENMTVADIGAGTGFFALRLAPKAGKVIAIDVDARFTEYLDSIKVLELPENMQDRLETRLADPLDPHLNPNEANIVMIVNTFMYIKDKQDYLNILKEGIAPGGRLLIIDFKKKRTPIGPPSDLRVPLYKVEEKLLEAGYQNISTNDTALDYQYIIVAER